MPKQPTAASLITGWWRPEFHESVAESSGVTTWLDQAGTAFNFSQGTGANRPLLNVFEQNGLPSLTFDGASDYMDGTDFDNLINNTAGTVFVAFQGNNLAAAQKLITDGSNRVFLEITAAGELRARNNDGANQQIGIAITSTDWHIGIWWHDSTTLRVYLDDPLDFESVASGTTTALGASRIGANSTPGEYFDGKIGEVITYEAALTDANVSFVFAYLAAHWLTRGDPLAQMRDVVSRRLVMFERPRLVVVQDVPLPYLDQELTETVALSHEHIPHSAGDGAGVERWNRALLNLHERTEDLDANKLTLTLADRGRIMHAYRESGVAALADDARREGVAISGQGPRRIMGRTTGAWVESPGDGRVVFVAAGAEAAELGGIYTDPAAEQLLLRSSFVSGTTGLTLTGTGGGSTIAADTATPLLFDTSVTTNSLKIVKGAAADLYAQWPVSQTIPASEKLCFSIDHRDSSGHALKWALQRSTDSQWWNNSGQTWGAGITWNTLAITGASTIVRDRSNVIAWPASSGTATVRVGYDGAGTGQTGYVYHVQVEAFGFATGRMVQDAAFVSPTRALTTLGWFESQVSSPPFRVFSEPYGTLGMRITTPWSAADLEAGRSTTPGGFLAILWTEQNAHPSSSHYWRGNFNGSRGAGLSRWEFAVKAAGAEDVAYNDAQPARGVTYAVVWRWTSTEGELGLAANTLDVFVDGVKGTSATITTRPTTIAHSRFQFNMLGASVKRVFSSPRCWTDEEIAAWSV